MRFFVRCGGLRFVRGFQGLPVFAGFEWTARNNMQGKPYKQGYSGFSVVLMGA